MFAATVFTQGLLGGFLDLIGAFLDATDQLFLLALGKSRIVIGELCKFLLQLAFGNVPVSFDCESTHIVLNLILVDAWLRAIKANTTKYLLQVTCRPVAVIVFPKISSICFNCPDSH